MAFLPRPVTRMMLSTPDATASSTPYWMIGLSTSGSISFGIALVAGRKRVPSPAAGNTALRTGFFDTLRIVSHDGGRGIALGAMLDPAFVREHFDAVVARLGARN